MSKARGATMAIKWMDSDVHQEAHQVFDRTFICADRANIPERSGTRSKPLTDSPASVLLPKPYAEKISARCHQDRRGETDKREQHRHQPDAGDGIRATEIPKNPALRG
jgi:hypothetical protein